MNKKDKKDMKKTFIEKNSDKKKFSENMYSKTYLITGAAGFIGSNFLKYILKKYKNKENIKVIIVDKITYSGNLEVIKNELKDFRVKFEKVDITDKKEVERIFSENSVNYVVNFAAETHVDRAINNSKVFLETNILGVQNLLENVKKLWSISKDEEGYPVYKSEVKYLQISTDEVYGSLEKKYDKAKQIKLYDDKIKKIIKNRNDLKTYGDEYFSEKTSINPRNPYSASKAGADHLVMAYNMTYKLPINIVRSSNNYGPHQYPEKLIPLMIKNILEEKKIYIYGKGENVRDWIYVEDSCEAIDLVLRKGKIGEVYNIGGYNEEKNIDIAKLVIKTMKEIIDNKNNSEKDKKINIDNINENLIVYTKDRLGHDIRYATNPEKIIKELNWYPKTNIKIGIEKTIKWYLKNREWYLGISKK